MGQRLEAQAIRTGVRTQTKTSMSEEAMGSLAQEFDTLHNKTLFQVIRDLGTVRARYPGLKGAGVFTNLWNCLDKAWKLAEEVADHIRIHDEIDWRRHP
jgi:hypothetical protein